MPTSSNFKPDPEKFRGRLKHHHLDTALTADSHWLHYGFSGAQHLHAKVDDDDFWFDSIMTIGDRLEYVSDPAGPKFKSVEMEFSADSIHWRAGTLDTNVRVLYWARHERPGFIIKI